METQSPELLADIAKMDAKYGKTHTYERVMGVSPKLTQLLSNQSVCYGDGKTYHWRLTKKAPIIDVDINYDFHEGRGEGNELL